MKTIETDADLLKDPEAWHREWNDKRNAQVAALIADGVAGHLWTHNGNLPREDWTDEQLRWFFWRTRRPESGLSRSEHFASSDARLHEAVASCMDAARRDERQRIVRALSSGLQALLGDEFTSLMYDFANENDINIGSD